METKVVAFFAVKVYDIDIMVIGLLSLLLTCSYVLQAGMLGWLIENMLLAVQF